MAYLWHLGYEIVGGGYRSVTVNMIGFIQGPVWQCG